MVCDRLCSFAVVCSGLRSLPILLTTLGNILTVTLKKSGLILINSHLYFSCCLKKPRVILTCLNYSIITAGLSNHL